MNESEDADKEAEKTNPPKKEAGLNGFELHKRDMQNQNPGQI